MKYSVQNISGRSTLSRVDTSRSGTPGHLQASTRSVAGGPTRCHGHVVTVSAVYVLGGVLTRSFHTCSASYAASACLGPPTCWPPRIQGLRHFRNVVHGQQASFLMEQQVPSTLLQARKNCVATQSHPTNITPFVGLCIQFLRGTQEW